MAEKIHQRQRGCDHAMETAERALKNLGFRVGEVRRVVAQLGARDPNAPPPIDVLVRDAISMLT